MSLPLFILASASPRRSELLRQLGLEFRVVPSEAPELTLEALSAGELAQINAYKKARAVSKKFPDAVTMGVDTLVALDGQTFGKPLNLVDAHRMVSLLQGRTHHVITGVCLIHLRAHRQRLFVEQTAVTFRPLTLEQIHHYHKQINPLDKAGAYAIQEHGDLVIEAISGSFSNVVGLPLERLEEELARFNVAIPLPACAIS
jgi:septum formation protein